MDQQDLRLELLRRRESDQELQRKLRPGSALDGKAMDRLLEIERENAEWLKSVINMSGWPLRSKVGPDGSDAAWLLAQHADHDPEFQRKCLDLLDAAVAHGEASLQNLAYLTDRVMLKERGVQVYGTQFRPGPDGPEPQPLQDPERIDELRRGMGLIPLAEYARWFVVSNEDTT